MTARKAGKLSPVSNRTSVPDQGDSIVGLFAGIAGIELGLHDAGFRSVLLCDNAESAQAVLRDHFPDVPIVKDVRDLKRLPPAQILTAGFPCQDLSMAGRKTGINGRNSGLVGEVFRLLRARESNPRWLLLENVPYMLHLDRGEGMRFLTQSLETLGFSWAYRVVDARAFGVPQRRQRVILVASRTEDPRGVLFADEAGTPSLKDSIGPVESDIAYGFYWTEGYRGLGWAGDAVPTIKGGSGLGIPSPPAIWVPGTGMIGTPDIRDAERLQGFEEDWTLPAEGFGRGRKGARWRLIGNAVCVPMSRWVATRLREPGDVTHPCKPIPPGAKWPRAAFGAKGKVYQYDVSMWPVQYERPHLLDFLRYPLRPLSARATAGFLKRAKEGFVKFPEGFLEEVEIHLQRMHREAMAV